MHKHNIRTSFKHRSFSLSLILSMTILYILNSCGIKDKQTDDQLIYDLESLQGNCVLNLNSLKNILAEDISSEIACLESNLDQYVGFVRRIENDFIEREDINKFVINFFPESKYIAEDILKLVFNLNSLILGDPNDKIQVKKLNHLFSIVRTINSEGRRLYQYINLIDKHNYQKKRDLLLSHTKSFSTEIQKTIGQYINKSDYTLNIDSFSFLIFKIFQKNSNHISLDNIRPWFFLKKLLLGGTQDTLSSHETWNFIYRLPSLLITAHDILYFQELSNQDNNTNYLSYYSIVKEINNNIVPANPRDYILTRDNLFDILKNLIDDKSKIDNLMLSIDNFKEKFIGGSRQEFQYKDIDKTMSWLQEVAEMTYYNALTYDHFQESLDSTHPISNLHRPNIGSFNQIQNAYSNKYWLQFEYISKHYRFFLDQNQKIHLSDHYKRFKSGFLTIGLIQWLIKKITIVYGHYPQHSTIKLIDHNDLHTLTSDFMGLIDLFGIWPTDIKRFIKEAIASSDLFMFQSNGDEHASPHEITEYIVNVFHATNVSSDVYQKLLNYCSVIEEKEESVDTDCFREHFIQVFFEELNYKNYYHKFYQFLDKEGPLIFTDYLINIETYTRLDLFSKELISKEEINRIIVTLTNLETAFLSLDRNKDNILQPEELDEAFLIYRGLIKNASQLDSEDSTLYRSIFFYLIKFKVIPSTANLMWFHLFGKKDKVTSTRTNISIILNSFNL